MSADCMTIQEEIDSLLERIDEILITDNFSKDECYHDGSWQDDLSWEYGLLVDDVCLLLTK